MKYYGNLINRIEEGKNYTNIEIQVGDKVKVKDTITGGTIDAEIKEVITKTWNGEKQYKVRYEDGRTFIKDERDFNID